VSLSIKLQLGVKAESELYRMRDGDVEVLHRYPEVSGGFEL